MLGMRLRITMFLALWALISLGVSHAQGGDPASPAPAAQKALLLLQVEVAGTIRSGSAVIVQSGPEALALTSFEAIRGAAAIHALVPGRGLVMAHLDKFAPEANLALLKISVADLPSARLGDSDLLRPDDPIEMITAAPVEEGNLATAMTPLIRRGKVGNILNRPGGTVLQLLFDAALTDESTGAPILSTNSGDVVGIALSRASAGNDAARTAIPGNLAAAFGYDLAKASGATASVRVLDGSQAPVEGAPGQKKAPSNNWLGYVIAVACGLLVVGGVAAVVLRRGNKPPPFSVLPRLPEGVTMAFVDSEGNLLPMERDPIRVGRAADNDWPFNDSSVSNYHARIKKNKRGSGYEVEDLRSTNGTWVRERRIGGAEVIDPGTKVRFGKIEVLLMTRSQSTG
jgi:hypothetical protein